MQTQGKDVALRGLTDGFREGVEIAHADRLVAFADAVVVRDEARIAAARAALLPLLGGAGVIDAAATVAAFHGFVRIADAIGIPHYAPPTGDDLSGLREEAGVNGFYRELAAEDMRGPATD